MRTARLLLAAAALAALASARPAEARARSGGGGGGGAALDLGADYLVDPEVGDLQLTLAVETPLMRHVTIGARFGGMYLSDPDRFGVPLDARLRIRAGRVYAEGLVGPWIVFDDADSLRMHAAFGFGLLGRSFSFGLEVGWLDPTSMVGVRMGFPL